MLSTERTCSANIYTYMLDTLCNIFNNNNYDFICSCTGDMTMESLLKQLSSLQLEMKLINEENNFLSRTLTEIQDKVIVF